MNYAYAFLIFNMGIGAITLYICMASGTTIDPIEAMDDINKSIEDAPENQKEMFANLANNAMEHRYLFIFMCYLIFCIPILNLYILYTSINVTKGDDDNE